MEGVWNPLRSYFSLRDRKDAQRAPRPRFWAGMAIVFLLGGLGFLLNGLAGSGGSIAVVAGLVWLLIVPLWLRSALRDRRPLSGK